MYSSCPHCAHEFSWTEKKLLSTKQPHPCPNCQTELLKNKRSTLLMNIGVTVALAPIIILCLVSIVKSSLHLTIPEGIELPAILLTAGPLLLIGLLMTLNGSKSATLEVVSEPQSEKKAA